MAYKAAEKELYAEWLSLPRVERKVDGKLIPTEIDFASHYKIDRSTLFRWKQDPKFRAKVHEYRLSMMGDKTSDVTQNMASQAASSDNPAWAKLYMEFMNEYRSSQEIIHTSHSEGGGAMLDSDEFIEFFATQLAEHPILAMYEIDSEKLGFAMKDLVIQTKSEEEVE